VVQKTSPTDLKEFSVVIPCFNAERFIHKCLSALSNQSIDRNRYEIIVVDDGSNDNTADAALDFCDRVIRTANLGSASARNTGVRHASGSVILFTDADCIPYPNWIETMTEPFMNTDISGVKGAYRTSQIDWVAVFVQAEYEYKYKRLLKETCIDFIDTYSAGFRRTVFDSVGGFDERYPGASVEDQEFSFRVARAGYKMVFVPDAIVMHHHADTLSWYFRKKKNIGYWKVMVLKRHPSKMVRDSHTPQTLKLQLPGAFFTVVFAILIPISGVSAFLVSIVVFLLPCVSEIVHCYRKNGLYSALSAPLILWVRSIALGIGLIKGLIHSLISSGISSNKNTDKE
jgi:glycosyltransferase involved in cell wall biosynthesis